MQNAITQARSVAELHEAITAFGGVIRETSITAALPAQTYADGDFTPPYRYEKRAGDTFYVIVDVPRTNGVYRISGLVAGPTITVTQVLQLPPGGE